MLEWFGNMLERRWFFLLVYLVAATVILSIAALSWFGIVWLIIWVGEQMGMGGA